jgi:hypothetical protein
MYEQKLPVMKVDVYGHYNAGFDSLLMGFRESKVTSYYGADYDHEMLILGANVGWLSKV